MKGQFWSIDMVFAMIVFTAALIILTSAWSKINSEFSVTYGYGIGNMQSQLQGLQQRILLPGSPANWNSQITVNSVNRWENISIGLGSGNTTTMSTAKMMELMAMANTNYQATKQPLGVGYDYYITIYSPNEYNISIGSNPFNGNAVAIQTATLPVVMDNGAVGTMKLMVWTNTTFGVG